MPQEISDATRLARRAGAYARNGNTAAKAKVDAELAERRLIKVIVDAAPKLDAEQRAKLAALLRPSDAA
jgi:hypothetical protein